MGQIMNQFQNYSLKPFAALMGNISYASTRLYPSLLDIHIYDVIEDMIGLSKLQLIQG